MAIFVKATVIEITSTEPDGTQHRHNSEVWFNAERITALREGGNPQESYLIIDGDAHRVKGSPEELLKSWFPRPAAGPILAPGMIPGLRKM